MMGEPLQSYDLSPTRICIAFNANAE